MFYKEIPHIPKMKDPLNQLSIEITRIQDEPLVISKIDLTYAYGQVNLSHEASRQCNFAEIGENTKGNHRFIGGLYGLSDIRTILQENNWPNIEIPNTLGLDDLIFVTREDKKTWEKLFTILEKFQEGG